MVQNCTMKLSHTIYVSLIAVGTLSACGGNSADTDNDPNNNELKIVTNDVLDSAQAMNTSINGKIFSIPSPIQMVSLIKDQDDVFDENMLTDPANVDNFTTTYKRAINMGVYGADLGYATVYENNTKAVSYLNSVDKLSTELGIAGAFNQELVERFIENGNDQDSMLVIMSEGYRDGDQYLKDNEQHDVASLILTGGWIESLYFATSIFEKTEAQEIANRIGEQSTALKTIIELLEDFNAEGTYTDLIADLTDLQGDFDKMKFNYQYIEPITYADKFKTNIKSKSSVQVEGDVLKSIVQKVKAIRNGLIG